MGFFSDALDSIKHAVQELEGGDSQQQQSNSVEATEATAQIHDTVVNRFNSFAKPREGNSIKWHVDGCNYFWAVSEALEQARESIWILDWWLSPELYLRRPPAANEQYRLDRMLQAAAERGVKVNIIVYKEVPQVLTVCSEHTRKALEELHENIHVFRHPDHIPDPGEFVEDLKDFFKPHELNNLDKNSIQSIYGRHRETKREERAEEGDDEVLYWAHHEKLCIVDGTIGFMGGLDLCFGRWDTHDHPIADAHPSNLENILVPGQDFNNARIFDFQDVGKKWEDNKLNRTEDSRMGWSDKSMSVVGPVVQDMKAHFAQRWNFIYDVKYKLKDEVKKYSAVFAHHDIGQTAVIDNEVGEGNVKIQLCRSASKWSHGVDTECSIANAYIRLIEESQHFVYIENQFFITTTGTGAEDDGAVKNQIGAAIVRRVTRAIEDGQKFKIIICIPAVPAFAGDLSDDSSLGTRAIMEYQYSSISRGDNSIFGKIRQTGANPEDYITVFNLRNYDRIRVDATMSRREDESGVDYNTARKEADDMVGAGYNGEGEGTQGTENYDGYQRAATNLGDPSSGMDSISACYTLNGPDVREIPWEAGGNVSEIDAFVSEELYIHTKLLIQDDRKVICGSANLNDRSQLGSHDSEIALVIEDSTQIESTMNGEPWTASKYAASLRRFIFRKHLGLLKWQDPARPDGNSHPVTVCDNEYDWDSTEDQMVADPLSEEFEQLWNGTAATNTEVFAKVFHPVPADNVRNWDDYKTFFSQYFIFPTEDKKDDEKPKEEDAGKNKYGHVVKQEFSEGEEGVREVKEQLSRVRGTLVKMPLNFLVDVDMAKEGLSFNPITAPIYT